MMEACADVLTVSRLAKHSNPATSSKYNLRGENAKHRAIQLLHVPYEE